MEQIINHYGKTMQKIVAIEELSELQKEITKDLRNTGNLGHIAEEIAEKDAKQIEIIERMNKLCKEKQKR